jgi:hypothetical protein
MKTRIFMNQMKQLAVSVATACSLFHCVEVHASPVERKLIEQAMKMAGREALEKGAKEAAERSAESAIRTIGKEAAEHAVNRGGVQILEAGARHGDDFWRLVGHVPEGVHYLAGKPSEALALARRFGNEAVRLEARVPGMAEKAAAHFGEKNLALLAKAPPEQVTRLIGYAERAAEPAVRQSLFDRWVRSGGHVLEVLDRHKALILTSGLTLALLDTAHGVSNGLEHAIPLLPEKAPEAVAKFAAQLGSSFVYSSLIISTAIGVCIVWRFRKPRSPSSANAGAKTQGP